jgi:hypothetical protein
MTRALQLGRPFVFELAEPLNGLSINSRGDPDFNHSVEHQKAISR